MNTIGSSPQVYTAQLAQPQKLSYSGGGDAQRGVDVSTIGGGVVAGLYGAYVGQSIGSLLGPVGRIGGALVGGYLGFDWGKGAGLKNSACIIGGMVVGGAIGGALLGYPGAIVGTIAGSYGGVWVANKIRS